MPPTSTQPHTSSRSPTTWASGLMTGSTGHLRRRAQRILEAADAAEGVGEVAGQPQAHALPRHAQGRGFCSSGYSSSTWRRWRFASVRFTPSSPFSVELLCGPS